MAEVQQEQVKGTYLYAVAPATLAPLLKDLAGVEDGKVRTITYGNLAAVISDVPTREELRPERRLVSAHQNVLKRLNELSEAVLPVSFGTIADTPEGVRSLLERYQDEFLKQLRKVQGKVEMRVRITYAAEKPSIFEFLVASSPELRQLRDRIAQAGRPATREEKIDLGQKFDAVITSVREENAEQLKKALGKIGEIRLNPPRSEKELVNAALLVPTAKQRDFSAMVQEAAQQFPDSFTVEELGPFPPYDFVELHVKS